MKTIHQFFLLVAFCVFCSGVNRADSIPSGTGIFTKIMESRQLIQSGHIVFDSTYSDANFTVHKKWNIWFDKSKIRSEVIRDGIIEAICFDCYGKQTRLYYTTQPPPDPSGKIGLTFYDGYEKPSPMLYIPDPRWFGCLTLTIEAGQYQFPAEMYGLKPEGYTEPPKVVSDTVADVDCWRIDYRPPGITSYSVWVDKSDESRVLRAESRFDVVEGGKKVYYIDRVDSETEKYQDKIWFPQKLTYKRTENGEVTMTAEARIKIHALNDPLPPDTFSPKGISFLKPDTPVAWHLDRDRPVPSGELVWDGNEVVALDEFAKMMRESRRLGPANYFFMLLGIALILIGLGMKLRKKVQ